MNDGELLLALALDRQAIGTRMAAAYVDDDGTATVHLLQRTAKGWTNLTLKDQTISTGDMAQKYDDVVLAGWDD